MKLDKKDYTENYKLGVIIPYRDRKEHLDIFIPYIKKHLDNQKITYKIYVIEQKNTLPFNRGLLNNIGASICQNEVDYYCFHDVDLLPDTNVDYRTNNNIYQVCGKHLDGNNTYKNKSYLYGDIDFDNTNIKWKNIQMIGGGVFIIKKSSFNEINGFPNNYFGWGKEDDMIDKRINFFNKEYKVGKSNKFYSLQHSRPKNFSINRLLVRYQYKYDIFFLNKKNIFNSGVNKLNFKILQKKKLENDVIKINVDFDYHISYIKICSYIFINKCIPIFFLLYLLLYFY